MPLPQRISDKRSVDPVELLLNILHRIAETETDSQTFEDCDEIITQALFIHTNLRKPFAKMYLTAAQRHKAECNIMQNLLRLQTVKACFAN